MEALKRGIPGYGSMLRYQPKSVWEYIARNWRLTDKQIHEEDREFRMSSKKYRAHFRVLKRPSASDDRRARARQLVVVAAAIDTVADSDSTFGVVFLMSDLDFEDWERGAKTIIKRFKILEPDEDDEDEEEGADADAGIFVDSTKKPKEWREARKKKLIPGWDAIDTENYLIVHNKEVKRPLLKKIAKHIEANPQAGLRADVPADAGDQGDLGRARLQGPRGIPQVRRAGRLGGLLVAHRRGARLLPGQVQQEGFAARPLPRGVPPVHPLRGRRRRAAQLVQRGTRRLLRRPQLPREEFKADVFRWRTGIIANAIARESYVPLDKFLKYTQGEYYATRVSATRRAGRSSTSSARSSGARSRSTRNTGACSTSTSRRSSAT